MSVDISFSNPYIAPCQKTTINEICGASIDGIGMGAYFTIVAVEGNVVTSDRAVAGYLATQQEVGAEVLIHHTLCKSTSPSAAVKAKLGKWEIRRITAIENREALYYYTLDKAPDIDLDNFYVQAAVIQEIQNLTLNEGDYLYPEPYNHDYHTSGILAVRIWDTLTFNGGHIELSYSYYNRVGRAATYSPYRPLMPQEQNGTLDTNKYSGCENSICKDRLPLNIATEPLAAGHILFLIAKNIVVTDSSSRIGNPNLSGVQYCRGSSDSKATHEGTLVGGSTIFIACNNWTGFDPAIISKYNSGSNGKGLGRAYIALGNINSRMLADEGLYALDAIQTPKRLNTACNVLNFGTGVDGNASNVSSYYLEYTARAISNDKKTFTCNNVSAAVGRLVLVHQMQKSAGQDVNSGKFYLARLASYSSSASTMTLDTACDVDPVNYYVQLLVLKEYNNLTINGTVRGRDWLMGVGGILPIVCYDTLDLRGGFLDVRGQGTKSSITNTLVGNNFMRSRLYIGQGHGTVFILARKILMNSATRIGSNSDGALFGGKAYHGNSYSAEGGYSGADGYYDDPTSSGGTDSPGMGGWGGGAGYNSYRRHGGWHGNAPGWEKYVEYDYEPYRSLQGAHILIVADSIDGFNLHAISTGGEYGDGRMENGEDWWAGTSGGAGYGGGGCSNGRGLLARYNYGGAGGYRGGGAGTANQSQSYESSGAHIFFGGGGAGAAFIYANKVTNQDTTGIVTS